MDNPKLSCDTFGLSLIGKQLGNLVKILPQLIYIIDLEQRKLVYINDRITDMLGYTKQDIEQMGNTLGPIMVHANMTAFSAEISQRFEGLKIGDSLEFTMAFRHKNGEIRTLKNTATLLQQNEEIKNRYILLLAEDITDKVAVDLSEVEIYKRELERQVAALNRSNQELEQFAYVASHDLQEPLRKIKAFGERLEKKYKDVVGDEGRFFIDRMINAAQRMNKLIDDLLTYSRASREFETPKQVALNDVVKNVIDDLEIKIQNENAQIIVENLPVIEAQAVQMQQLFQNLIENALKFRKPELSPVVHITAEKVSKTDFDKILLLNPLLEYFQFTVSDNGIGFDSKYADQIFAIFQRLHGRTEYEGTGLGLAICRKIVETHNGYIMAKGEEGVGATFIFYLPTTKNK